MLLSCWSFAILFFASSSALPAHHPLATFEGLTHNTEDHSTRFKDPPEKYFHESTFSAHYDGRFASKPLPASDRQLHLRYLLQSYFLTMASLGAETWLMHGSLLAWWWNGHIFPWDTDIDTQMALPTLTHLATFHNMTLHTHLFDPLSPLSVPLPFPSFSSRSKSALLPKKYLLEVNPHALTASAASSGPNTIAARYVDTATGLFVDITTLHPAQLPLTQQPILHGHDRHVFRPGDLFPLRRTEFEGVGVRVPYRYQAVLTHEYGEAAVVGREYRKMGWVFDGERGAWGEWVRMGEE